MLAHLRIQNLALIDELELSFTSGFNVLTGETGAGKSIAVGALGIVLGQRASAGIVRRGCPSAQVEAVFTLQNGALAGTQKALERAELPACDEGTLLIRRIVSAQGKSRQYINGAAVTVAQLKAISQPLVDVTSQHAHQSLTGPGKERALLDAFGGHGPLLEEVAQCYDAALAAAESESALALDEAEKAQRLDWLTYQIEEIDALDPVLGEDESLKEEIDRLKNADALRGAFSAATHALMGEEEDAATLVLRASAALAPLVARDATLESIKSRLDEAAVLIEDASADLVRTGGAYEADPTRLDELVDRLHLLRRLMTKHGGALEFVFSARERLVSERDALVDQDALLAQRAAERQDRCNDLVKVAKKLSAAREQTRSGLVRALEAELTSLHMSGARLDIVLTPVAVDARLPNCAVSRRGAEKAHFELQANVGERPGPLSKTASGGELSRVVLAIKRVLLKNDPTPLSLFDEVDAGVGGVVADAIAEKLAAIAAGRQVICITHLAQIAARASTHFVVDKRVEGERTNTRIARVVETDRTQEIARMLAGRGVTDDVLRHAEQMCHEGPMVTAKTKRSKKKAAEPKKPATKKSVTKKAAEPKKPATKKSVTKKPATKKPATKKPATKKAVSVERGTGATTGTKTAAAPRQTKRPKTVRAAAETVKKGSVSGRKPAKVSTKSPRKKAA